ncbi:MAG: NAD-dependent epimerase/dehydratase family protein [Bacteroidota bacterium]|jgi:nucleoside-diphosphate-sugar epimerase|nr:NAD-dependent epimerase/dehydratase family protein [Bacteroidota bacterium]
MTPTICITGVAGFIGSNLADRLLREGYHVLGIDNLSYGVREQIPDGVEFHPLDIRSEDIFPVIARASHVFHLAAKNCISDCQIDPVETADINVRGTANVFEAARRGGVEKVIYAESSALYEGSTVFPTPEEEARPESFYALSKYASMLFAEGYARFHGVRSTALRYFNVYGPRQDYRRSIPPLFSAFIIALREGRRPVIYGSGEKRRDFVYVDDVNDFHLRCLTDERTTGQVYNLGSGGNHSVNEIYAIIARLLESDVTPEYRDNLPGEAETTLADITRARALGWAPKTSLEEGLAASIAYIRTLNL